MGRTAKNRTDREVAKAIALQLPDVEVGAHHGKMELRVHNKVFATFPAETKLMSVRNDEGWHDVSMDDIDRATLQALLIESWLVQAPPAVRRLHEKGLANRVR